MLRALVRVTLTLMWASHLTVWSTTAHLLVAGISPSVILPRHRGDPINISDLKDGAIEARRAEFNRNPRSLYVSNVVPFECFQSAQRILLPYGFSRKKVDFQAKNNQRIKLVLTQEWYEIPNDLAEMLTLKEDPFMKIPGTEIEVPVLVTIRYSRPKEGNPECQVPVLQVAPFEPPEGWNKGTAVWIHLLPFLQRPGHIDRDSILKIAKANPDLSRMLYEKNDGTGFVLLNRYDRVVYLGSPSFTPAVSD